VSQFAPVPSTPPSTAPSSSSSPTPLIPDTDAIIETVRAECRNDGWCALVTSLGGSDDFAALSYALIAKPLRILVILVVAALIRFMLHRAIKRLATSTSRAAMPALLKPLREKAAEPVAGNEFIPERRRQRAEAIGSVLRSFVTAVVFTMAVLLVMSEFGFDLAPLLASAGIAGVALGFGAQSLVKDLIAGLFMLLEDQYGVGDTVDLGEATGVVEAVGLRITTVRDARGVLWYIRNGEIIRVGNKSQGWALVVIDMPIGFVNSERAGAVLRTASLAVAENPDFATLFLEPPDVVGVEQMTVDGAVIRTIAKTTADGQFPVQRELRRALTEALEESGIAEQIAASRMYPRPAVPPTAGA
jgi:small conductance mechanosensitive channel